MDDSPAREQPGAAAGGAGAATPVEVDGRETPGGARLLRAALCLSLCTERPVRLTNIRGDRPTPGLERSQLAWVHAAVAVSGGEAEGAAIGATDITFRPGAVRHGDYTIGVGSAGNCLLALQLVWPALAGVPGESRIVLRGCTHSPGAPSFHFIERAYAPLMARLGAAAALRLRRHGFLPTGGGGVEASIAGAPTGLEPFDLVERGPLREAFAECLVAAVPRHVAGRELDTLGRALGWSGDQLRVPVVRQNEGPGNALMATLVHDGVTEVVTGIGEKGVSAETVARGVVREVREYLASEAALGPDLAEQWLLPLAVAVARRGAAARFSCSGVTARLRGLAGLVARFLPVTVAIEPAGSAWLVRITA